VRIQRRITRLGQGASEGLAQARRSEAHDLTVCSQVVRHAIAAENAVYVTTEQLFAFSLVKHQVVVSEERVIARSSRRESDMPIAELDHVHYHCGFRHVAHIQWPFDQRNFGAKGETESHVVRAYGRVWRIVADIGKCTPKQASATLLRIAMAMPPHGAGVNSSAVRGRGPVCLSLK
jgi:hypothetical protein